VKVVVVAYTIIIALIVMVFIAIVTSDCCWAWQRLLVDVAVMVIAGGRDRGQWWA